VPSGNEPYLVAGSPRGAPYHAKTHYQLRAGRPPLPRFLGPAQTDPLIAAGRPVDMGAQVWPLMAKEIAWGWYHELGRGHPERLRVPWPEFVDRFAALDWGTEAMDAFLAEVVPDPLDRFDLDALDRPLDGITADSLDALQPLVRAHIAEDLRQHVEERHTPHLGAFVAMLSVYAEVGRLAEVLSARSRAVDVNRWQSFFNSVASGPPGFRVRELLALARAGFVRFLGPGMAVEIVDGEFRATSAAIPKPSRPTCSSTPGCPTRAPPARATRWSPRSCGTARRARRCCATSAAPCCATPARCACGPPTARSWTRPGGHTPAGSPSARTPPCAWQARSPGPA
jgi:hypothetical protein